MAAGFFDLLSWLLGWKSQTNIVTTAPGQVVLGQTWQAGNAVGQLYTAGSATGTVWSRDFHSEGSNMKTTTIRVYDPVNLLILLDSDSVQGVDNVGSLDEGVDEWDVSIGCPLTDTTSEPEDDSPEAVDCPHCGAALDPSDLGTCPHRIR